DDDKAKVQKPVILEMPLVEVEGLKMGIITGQPSDVEPLSGAKVEEYMCPDDGKFNRSDCPKGRKMVVVTLYATSYVTTTKKQVDIVAEFNYAIAKLPHGQPDWRTVQSVALPVGITTSATENQTRLIDGDLSEKVS